jgi:putative phosphoribosyl transferase
LLAARLSPYADCPEVLVLALPRGGVAVGVEVAEALRAQLDVFVVRKLGVPGHEELGLGAVASGGVRTLNESVIHLSLEQQRALEPFVPEFMRKRILTGVVA